MIKSLLAAAKALKLQPIRLAQGAGLDLSSSSRVLSGKARRPSFMMVCGLAKMTGYKIELVHDLDYMKTTFADIDRRAKNRKKPKKSKRTLRRGRGRKS